MKCISNIKLKVAIGMGGGGCILELLEPIDNSDILSDINEYSAYLDEFFYQGSKPPERPGIYIFVGNAYTTHENNSFYYKGEFKLLNHKEQLYYELCLWRGIEQENGDIICEKCGGAGVRTYSSSATWRGGIGGQTITTDICDKCWGSGKENKPWINLRRINKGNK